MPGRAAHSRRFGATSCCEEDKHEPERIAASVMTWVLQAPAAMRAQNTGYQLRAIEGARLRSLVHADVATARRLHVDDCELVNPAGRTMSKEQYLGDIASGALDYLEREPKEMRVRLYGKSAVISVSGAIAKRHRPQRRHLLANGPL